MAKGITYAIVAIAAIVGIAAVLMYAANQGQIGSQYATSYMERAAQDLASQKLEDTKVLLIQSLKFAGMNSALLTAEQGGTVGAITWWYCNNKPQPPELNEVMYALSNKTKKYINSYIKKLRESKEFRNKGINISNCNCVQIASPPKEECMEEDCPYFSVALLNESILVNEPVKTSYKGSIEAKESPIRFWMFYYRLYDFFKKNNPARIITQTARDNCPKPKEAKFKLAYNNLCDELVRLLDKEASEIKDCKDEEGAWVCKTSDKVKCRIFLLEESHQTCERDKNVQPCFKFQGGTAYHIVRITLDDYKYKPLGDETMEWNIYAKFDDDVPECRPING